MGGLATSERKHKKRSTGVVGVFVNTYTPTKKNVTEYRFQIKVQGVRLHTVYIGTENTWMDNYEEKLSKAIKLRNNLLRGQDESLDK